MFKLSLKSRQKLEGVYPPLIKIVERAISISTVDFMVTAGKRDLERQVILVKEGKSKTLKSYHLYGMAVDLVPVVGGKPVFEVKKADGAVDWVATKKLYVPIHNAIKIASVEQRLTVDWGWELWGWDMPHHQITKIQGKDSRNLKW